MNGTETRDTQGEENLQEDEVQTEAAGEVDQGGEAIGEESGIEGPVEEETEAVEEDPLVVAQAEAADNYDRFLRASAELDNLRKRTAKVRIETREGTLRDVLLDIAPILDNMQRALAQDSEDVQALKEGVSLIYSQFSEALKRYGLEEMETIGQPFDPNLHEAMLEIEHGEYEPGTVVEETEKGYKLNGNVVRAARVVVSKAGGDNG